MIRRGAGVGLVSTAVALGAAELVASADRSLRSPVVDVGARVIDAAPPWVKEFAISTFGTNDKTALLVGIGVLLVVYAVVLGTVAIRRRRLGVAGVALFGVIGVVAARTASSASPHWWSILPTVVGTACGAAAIWWLSGLARGPLTASDPAQETASTEMASTETPRTETPRTETPSTETPSTDETSPVATPTLATPGRRAFLAAGAGLGVAAVAAGGAGRWLSRRFDVAAERAKLVLAKARRPLAPMPKGVALDVDGLTPFVTPNDRFYRIDTALLVPQVQLSTWRLRITGMVDHPVELSFDELTARELIEADITLSCVSNEVGGTLAGNARWLGVPLAPLLREVGVQRGADQIVGRSVDGFTAGFPVQAALDRADAMIAIGMNGEPLPIVHGFPARLLVPGLYGYVSATKWLTELELTTFDRFDAYWAQRGWSNRAPIKTFSRIDTPAPLRRIPAGRHAVAGVAWAQTRGIDRVEVRVDGGPWQAATLADELNDTTWRQWMLPVDFTSGQHTVECRATDRTGAIQTEARSEPMPDGATGWHSVVVLVT